MVQQNPLQAQYAASDLVTGTQPTGPEVAEFIQGGQSVQLSVAQIKAASLVGTTTNDNAPAGSIGEFVTQSVALGAPIALVTTTAKTVTSIPLTAGDWDVRGAVGFTGAAGTLVGNRLGGSLSPTTNVLDSSGSNDRLFAVFYNNLAIFSLSGGYVLYSVGPSRFSLSAPASVFLIAIADFTVNTCSAFGTISARRVR